jgi:bifunctional non-homologous end joining protein LigD/DNA ligase-1
MDLFEKKKVSPMLVAENKEPFDSEDYLYELKLDGFRCVAYLDRNITDLRSRQNNSLTVSFPELSTLHRSVPEKCILDGELIVLSNGRPNFGMVQRRALMTDPIKIKTVAQTNPACYVAFDILYYGEKELLSTPLSVRKQILATVITETEFLVISRIIDTYGTALFSQVKSQGLEGVVAKRKDSCYHAGKRTKDWVKFKYPGYNSNPVI